MCVAFNQVTSVLNLIFLTWDREGFDLICFLSRDCLDRQCFLRPNHLLEFPLTPAVTCLVSLWEGPGLDGLGAPAGTPPCLHLAAYPVQDPTARVSSVILDPVGVLLYILSLSGPSLQPLGPSPCLST